MIVITLTKVPQSLRGDLTKWYQEVQAGVYVGNVSARIRDLLWDRIMKNIGNGEATMVYNTNSELGYQMETTRKDYQVIDYDGIPLMMRLNTPPSPVKHGFSNAAKFHRAKVMTHRTDRKKAHKLQRQVTAIDLETTGLKAATDKIISIGAVKKIKNGEIDQFYKLIQVNDNIQTKITNLTGISSDLLRTRGIDLDSALQQLKKFIGQSVVVGYNLRFDQEFLSYGFKKIGQPDLSNQMVDLMPVIKKTNKFLDNYRLSTVLKEYSVRNSKPHHALSDAQATLELETKLIENGHLLI